ncbi:MAG: hypothetical protein PVG38_11720 [Gammaproteobacteria bacterium]|jgi:hypothetical protein
MVRGIVIAFIAGWLIWFWIDKNPYALGPLPEPVDGAYAANFQVTVDLLKAGRFKAAFVYLWHAHYLIVSLAAGLLLSTIGSVVSHSLSRRRLARPYLPRRRSARRSEASDPADAQRPGPKSDSQD